MTTSDDATAAPPCPTAAVWATPAGRVARRLLGASGGIPEGVDAALVALRAEAVPALLAVVDEAVARDDAPALRHAALWLAALRARAALPTLCRLVIDGAAGGDALVVVARALVELVGPADVSDSAVRAALEQLAGAADRAARAFAAEAFAALGDPRSRARVEALADDPDNDVQDRARAALRRFVDRPAALGATVTLDDFAALAVAAGAGHGGALQPLLDELADPRRPVRDAAVAALVRAGRPAVPFLIDRLNQPLPRARVAAALALGRLQPPEATGPLLVAATAPAATVDEAELRPVALRALAHCLTGAEQGLSPSLLPLTRDPDRFVRAAALLCLGRLADRAGMRAVALALFDDDPFVVESAAIALSEGVREGDAELVLPLLRALVPSSPPRAVRPAVKEAILIALGRIDVLDDALRVRVRHVVRADVDAATASARKAAIVLLERSFAADDPPPLPLVDAVLARTGDAHPDVRVVAASFVARHLPPGMGGAVATLARALARRERALSLLCVEALRRHDTAPARAALLAALRDDDEVVARCARDLYRAFSPTTTTWTFTPRAPTHPSPSTGTGSAKRRPAAVSDGRAVVEARFAADDEPGG